MNSPFLQIHFLTSYPAVLLNRDDAGFAKRIPFGGVTRTRISSQCLKRHWRTHDGAGSLAEIDGVELSVRSRLSFEKYVYEPLMEDGVDEKIAAAVVNVLMAEVLGESAKTKASKDDDAATAVRTNQVTVLGRTELSFVLEQAREVSQQITDPKEATKAVKDHFTADRKKNLKGLKMAAGLGAAMFGRMVTSDMLARTDAAVHVAHAFTVHPEASESDYFSAVDDLLAAEGEMGSGHINSVELNSGLFYGYLNIDLPLLVSNLEGCDRNDWRQTDRKVASEVVKRLVSIIATVSPGAKIGSTAPHSYAQMMLIEAGEVQPRSLANAFLKPVRETPDLLGNAYKALGSHLVDLDEMYGQNTERHFMALGPFEDLNLGERHSLGEVVAWAAGRVEEG